MSNPTTTPTLTIPEDKAIDDEARRVSAAQARPSRAAQIRERIRASRRRAREDTTIELELPGTGLLTGRFKVLGWDELAKIEERTSKDKAKKAPLYGQSSTIAAACEEILIAAGEGGQLVPLGDLLDDGKGAVQFDRRLAEFVAENDEPVDHLQTAGSVVRFTFPTEVAVSVFHGELMEWMKDGNGEADDQLLGESIAAGR